MKGFSKYSRIALILGFSMFIVGLLGMLIRVKNPYWISLGKVNLPLSVVVLLAHGYVARILSKVDEWLHMEKFPRERKVIFALIIIFIGTFLLRIHLGFWFCGIGGWTYEDKSFRGRPVERCEDFYSGVNLAALKLSLEKKYLDYVPRNFEFRGNAMLIHFRNGSILPTNPDLLGVVFPDVLMGNNFNEIHWDEHPRESQAVAMIYKDSLDRRRNGKRGFLPLLIAYPAHSVYRSIDYRTYPPSEEIESISFWNIKVCVDQKKMPRILSADLRSELNVKKAGT